jgi:hypothetical protein
MSSLFERQLTFSLPKLRQEVAIEALARLQPLLLLQVLLAHSGLSQALDGAFAHPQTVARSLFWDGQRKLRKLLSAAPRLNLSLDRVLDISQLLGEGENQGAPEEDILQALLEMCVGLMLQCMNREDTDWSNPTYICKSCITSPLIPFFPSLSRFSLPRARSCLSASLI